MYFEVKIGLHAKLKISPYEAYATLLRPSLKQFWSEVLPFYMVFRDFEWSTIPISAFSYRFTAYRKIAKDKIG